MLHLFTLSAWVHTPATDRRSGCHIQPAGIITAFATFPHSPAGDTYLCCTLFLIWVDYWKRLVETEWKHVYLLHSEWSTSIVYLSAFILIGEDFRIYFQRYPGRTFQYQQSVAASLVRNSSGYFPALHASGQPCSRSCQPYWGKEPVSTYRRFISWHWQDGKSGILYWEPIERCQSAQKSQLWTKCTGHHQPCDGRTETGWEEQLA